MSTGYHVFKWPTVHANKVHVSGSFDGWTSRHELEKDWDQGCFRVRCRIPKEKKVYYKFIVDGEWFTSEEDTTESDEHGNVNNVVMYQAGEGDGGGSSGSGSGDTDTDAAVIVHDSDGSSEFTSISHPNSETRWEEIQQEVEATNADGDEEENGDDEDLTSSVQITLKDTSSVTASIQSRTAPSTKLAVPKHGDSFMGRLRSIFHK